MDEASVPRSTSDTSRLLDDVSTVPNADTWTFRSDASSWKLGASESGLDDDELKWIKINAGVGKIKILKKS